MTSRVRQILSDFEALPDNQQHEAAVEILRRVKAEGNVPNAALVELADELFQAMDADEDQHAAS